MNNILDLAGRILISAIFLFEAIDSMLYADKTKLTMAEYGITWNPDLLLYLSIAGLLIGGIMVLIGYRIRFAVWLLLVYWLPVICIKYPFWHYTGLLQRDMAIHFMRGMAIAGGLLMIAAHGGGKFSVQRLFRVSKIPKDDD